jgi:DNA polymerase III epsilon subunit-like protein
MKRTLVFDTETTSLLPISIAHEDAHPRIIEFYGAIVDERGAILRELEFLAHPGAPISDEIRKITGINDEMVAGLPPFAAHIDEVDSLLCAADSVVAHNLSYDFSVLSVEFAREGRKPSWPLIRFCTVEQTIHLKGFRLSLANLHEYLFGEAFTGAHRAKRDVTALIRCFNKLRDEDML